jgi:hypothetical protein
MKRLVNICIPYFKSSSGIEFAWMRHTNWMSSGNARKYSRLRQKIGVDNRLSVFVNLNDSTCVLFILFYYVVNAWDLLVYVLIFRYFISGTPFSNM